MNILLFVYNIHEDYVYIIMYIFLIYT